MNQVEIVENLGFCRLGGFARSNPEILGSYPPLELDLSKEEQNLFLNMSLPEGIDPGTYHHAKFKNHVIFSYVFALKSNGENTRNDLASVAAVISGKHVNLEHFEILFKEVIELVKNEMEKFDPITISTSLERIYNGMNESKRIKISEVIVDIPRIIEGKKLNLKKKDVIHLKGAFF